jgi:site-specific recombinase XerD
MAKEWLAEIEGEYTPAPPSTEGGREEKWLPLILSRRQVLALLNSPAEVKASVRLALRTIYASGMRPEEVVALTPEALDRDNGRIWLGPERSVVVDGGTMEELVAGLPWVLTVEELQAGLELAARESGILALYEATGHRLLAKALRHAFATHCLENGMDLFTLHRLLGLLYLNTTEMYVETAIARWRSAYEHCHPLAMGQGIVRGGGEHAPLTPQDVLAMIRVANEGRDRLIVRTIYSSALREAELVSLVFADVVCDERRIWVRKGKDSLDRYTLIDQETAEALRLWQGDKPANELIFPISTRQVQRVVVGAAEKAGLLVLYPDMTIAPHSLRHAHGNHCYHNGIDLFSLKKLIGHKDLDNTIIYVNCELPEWRKAYDRSHPLAGS